MRLMQKVSLAPRVRVGRPYLLLYIFTMSAIAVPFVSKTNSEWDACYVLTAKRLATGEDIYAQFTGGYVYPPFQSLLALPVLGWPVIAGRLAWFAVNAVALWLALRAAWRLAGGPDLESKSCPLREHLAAGIGLVIGMSYFLNALMHHQTDIVLAWLVFSGCETIVTNRYNCAAIFFGLAAAMKCTPLLFAIYFLFRGRVLAAGLLLAVFGLASLLPDLVSSPADYSTWLQKWYAMFLAPMFSVESRFGIWASGPLYNQSLIGSVHRWCTTGWSLDGGFAIYPVAPRLSPSAMKLLILAAALVCGVLSLVTMLRNRDMAWHCGIVCCGMLLFSPMSGVAHFGLLVLPAFLLARAVVVKRGRLAAVPLALMLGLAAAVNKDLLGAKLYSLGLWYGSAMAGAIVALLCGWAALSTPPKRG